MVAVAEIAESETAVARDESVCMERLDPVRLNMSSAEAEALATVTDGVFPE
jgi:hypothetical protein